MSAKLGEAFEETVWSILRHEDMNPVQVRFGVWREGADGMKFVCKVEYASNRRVPWSWWSGLVRTPQDLANELTRALAIRRKRQVVTPSLSARRVRRAPAPAPRPVPPAAASASAPAACPRKSGRDHGTTPEPRERRIDFGVARGPGRTVRPARLG